MENVNQVFEFYFLPTMTIDEEFGSEYLEEDDQSVPIYPSYYDAFQAYMQRHH